MKTDGSHGPYGFDANEWRKVLSLFKDASSDSSKMIAKGARRKATEAIAPEQLEPYAACMLIPSDKNPSVYPISLGEVSWKNIRLHHHEKHITGSPRSRIQQATTPWTKKRN